MFPLWDVAIAPVLRAARARRIVEIGALRGETTDRMLESLGPDAELHVIDPVPAFDPSEHEGRFAGRYHFHEALSLDVLGDLGAFDAALIDGDHNWYTVLNELRLLAATARAAGAPLPVLVMHDVGWPYGRRDLYYAPEQIPEEFRQPHARAGMRPGNPGLVRQGGVNATLHNAEREGGARNGVLTALDDFVAEHDRPVRRVLVPSYFGLAIVAEEERLARQPELAAALDRLEGAEARGQLLEVGEEVRLRAVASQHTAIAERTERTEQLARATARHLEVVKAALLNEHYLDHEVRFALLLDHIRGRRPMISEQLRDPVRNDQEAFRLLLDQRTGPAGPDHIHGSSFLPFTAMGRAQLDHLERCLDTVRAESVPGDLAECGTGRGGGAVFLRAWLDAHEVQGRRVWVADRFRAAPEPHTSAPLPAAGLAGFQADLNVVRDAFARFGLLDDRVRFLQGPMPASLADAGIEQLALLRVGRSAGADLGAALAVLYDRVAPGGFVIVEAVDDDAVAQVEAFRSERGLEGPLERVDGSSVAWRRPPSDPPAVPAARPAVVAGAARPPLAPAAPADAVDLTVVVVVYDMRREAARTLHSLSRTYQQGIDGIDYEVVVVENGSHEEQRLGEAFVAGFGPEFRYVDLGGDALPSPAAALNRGIALSRGRAVALMIDGAHVLTPGVLRFGLAGLATYRPAIVATQQWYVGPGQQGDAMDHGYDEAYEDRLFEQIGWPAAGHRLFEIGHFIGDRDWFDGVWESNCLFVDRGLLEQVGGFDESFSEPGGGYTNLEIYERLGSSPGTTVVTILGEGSFHQSHGGTTTNQPDADERRSRVFGYGRRYAELKGRAFRGPGKPIHYVGRIGDAAQRRTKPRRLSAKAFAAGAAANLGDGKPDKAVPVPDELQWAFTDAVWRNLPWQRTTWLGHEVATAPTDLLAYQEIIDSVRPDWIVEIGAGDGGRSLYLASMCELVDHGEVLSVGETATVGPNGEGGAVLDGGASHRRLRRQVGAPLDPATVEGVRATVGTSERVVVVLGSCVDHAQTVRQFEAYHSLVGPGSYVVVTDTVVNGHPVWPWFGPGPGDALKQILKFHGDFVADPDMEKYSLSFNPGGFLRRMP